MNINELLQIWKAPRVHGNVSQSIYQSHQILWAVKALLDRGDSRETIQEAIGIMEYERGDPE